MEVFEVIYKNYNGAFICLSEEQYGITGIELDFAVYSQCPQEVWDSFCEAVNSHIEEMKSISETKFYGHS